MKFEGFFLAWVDCKQSARTVKLKVLSEAENGKRLFFFSRLNGRVRLARFSRVRLLGYLRCLIADFKKKKDLFAAQPKK